jgi:hypothetical protein
MAAGAATKPAYYKSKINLALLFAPPVGMSNCPNLFLDMIASTFARDIIYGAVMYFQSWNMAPYN